VIGVDAIAQSGPTLVEQNEPRERRQPMEKMTVAGILPMNLEIGDEAWHEHEVEWAMAHDLLCDADLAARGVSRLGRFQLGYQICT
jgi:hypothetical protein